MDLDPAYIAQVSKNMRNPKFWDTLPDEKVRDTLDALRTIDDHLQEEQVRNREGTPMERGRIRQERDEVAKKLRQMKRRAENGPITEDNLKDALRIAHNAASRYPRIQAAVQAHFEATMAGDLDPEPHDLELWQAAHINTAALVDA